MDTATSRSMTVLVGQRCVRERTTVLCAATVCAKANGGVSRATVSPSARHAPVIPKVPAALQLRHSARSRGIHAPWPHLSRSTRSTPTSSFPAQSRNPSPPAPTFSEVPAAPQLRHSARSRGIHFPCQCFNQRSQRPLHATMDTATSRSMTVLVGQRCVRERTTVLCAGAVCAEADGGVSRATVSPSPDTPPLFRPLPSFPKYPQHSNFVIPCAVAESISPAPTFSEVPAAPQLRHSARSRGIHLPLPMLQPEKPAPSARHHGYCDFAQYDGVGRATVCAGTGCAEADGGVVLGDGVFGGRRRCCVRERMAVLVGDGVPPDTPSLLTMGNHKGCRYALPMGNHKGCPYTLTPHS